MSGVPPGPRELTSGLERLAGLLEQFDVKDLKVVVFGGGTGLSNLVGGDSRHPSWPEAPFNGLKELFPRTTSIVCVTDDGGSTGELLKDLDVVAVGDLRHVLLSSIRQDKLHAQYGLNEEDCLKVAASLHQVFNFRYAKTPAGLDALLSSLDHCLDALPAGMSRPLLDLMGALFTDERLQRLVNRPHCLGNLLLVSAICRHNGKSFSCDGKALIRGLRFLADLLGGEPDAVLPCTFTPARLKILYGNGVMVTGEYKSGHANRGFPVERVMVEASGRPEVPAEVLASIRLADIILFAPGSLYTSIIPIMQMEEISVEIRKNTRALKLLVTNIWVQKGETDLVTDEPGRRFHVSDLINAYHRNIPGGIEGLFNEVLALSLDDIPGSILQSYALEGKVPIYLDRENVRASGLGLLECRIFSAAALKEKRVVQHDSLAMAKTVRAVWAVRKHLAPPSAITLSQKMGAEGLIIGRRDQTPSSRLAAVAKALAKFNLDPQIRERVLDILWRHGDISLDHLSFHDGIMLVEKADWVHPQEWDRIFSFYDPVDRMIKIRRDVSGQPESFELAYLVALGESLLGNYAAAKEMLPVEHKSGPLGRIYQVTLRPPALRQCYLDEEDLHTYLELARINRSLLDPLRYTRLVNGQEGFTPPGLLFGLIYAWYLDNRFAAHIEYKMAILKMEVPNMIPEQVKVSSRRRQLVDFFRRRIFGHDV
ncbi:MAG: YvcK family protein [Proteobacteria bacterium]|nr:YvcK family protein [Pseudomonadota bacterium]MBU1738119.1 YvcK family protein [Pseudomonadota bacterium]